MGTKRSTKARATKTVTITLDVDTFRELGNALKKLCELASAYDAGADDPAVKRELLSTGKRASQKR
jgi:hypothetical protein